VPDNEQSGGTCRYCGRELTRRGATRHLSACPERRVIIEDIERTTGPGDRLYHLRAQDQWSNDFWLDLEMRGSATLQDLDKYLRTIWLECCGHMSRFSLSGWGSDDLPMGLSINQVIQPGLTLLHTYDFGTESNTLIRAISMREGKPTTPYPIVLMARNQMPKDTCTVCGEPAAWLCMECLIEDDVWGSLCDDHLLTHPHDDYGEPVPLVNSPRVGSCGYIGPADPPY